MTRRVFQNLALLLFPVVYGAGFAAAAVRFLWPPPPKPREKRREIDVSVDDLAKPGAAPVEIEFNEEKVFVLHDGERVRAVEATCTHLGCQVKWNGGSSRFDCPCHGAAFGRAGEVVRKPADGPLKQFALDEKALAEGRIVVLDRVERS